MYTYYYALFYILIKRNYANCFVNILHKHHRLTKFQKSPSKWLLKVVKVTPKVIQTINVALGCLSELEDRPLLLRTPHI